jgi:heme exporter protein D
VTLPLAHVGHYLWVLYVIPILIVVAAIVRNTVAQRRLAREDSGESSTVDGGKFTNPD